MNRKQLIKKYIDFFKSKQHKEILNASLIPENDPTVLFVTAGMHPLVPFLLGQKHPQGKRLVNVQRCIRTSDIDEVGDETHHTFFEMFGNWSLGDYWKKEAIEYTFEFLTKTLKIPKERLAVTVFAGDDKAPKDEESADIWKNLGIDKIIFLKKEDNWWNPTGKTGPCGPDTEIFYWRSNKKTPKLNHKTFDEDWTELGNNVFMEYEKKESGKIIPAKEKNVDFGGGVERTIATLNELEDHYLTDVWLSIIKQIEKLSNKKYEQNKREIRIIADHIKAAVFIINDGIIPSNKGGGYVLRRLIRRAIVYARKLNLENFTPKIAEPVFKIYDDYKFNKKIILKELKKEEEKFNQTLEKGFRIFEKVAKTEKLDGKQAFLLYQSFGFPIEMTTEIAKEKNIKIDEKGFHKALKEHQELSRTATAGKFKSGLADDSEKTKKLHTASHLLLSAIQKILKNKDIHQKGSNINSERIRLDFNFDRKLTDKEIKEIENLVNKQIKKAIPVEKKQMSLEQAKKQGACGAFEHKYKGKISVYNIGNFSKEICTGPHVKNTKEITNFKIKKQDSCGSGVRRIKAILG